MFAPLHRGGEGPPLVLLHGFTDTWRTWELVLPRLERRHDVLAPTLPGDAGGAAPPRRRGGGARRGHAGGPPLDGRAVSETLLADAVEGLMDDAGFQTADVVGNSMGGFAALQLAARGRARSVVALAPGGGWAGRDRSFEEMVDSSPRMHALVKAALPSVDAIVATREGRRRATADVAERFEHIPPELVAHFMCGAAAGE